MLRRGATIGRYVVLEQVGVGGMGVVYAAYDPSLDRRVAIKLMRAAAPAGSAHRERMLAEARALARLDHPNVVPVHDVGVANDVPFLAMEFVEGLTLQLWLGKTRPSWRRCLEVFIAAGSGLAAAHAVGLVHRDFKPDNVIISEDGRVRVLDFGLAVADITTSAEEDRSDVVGSTALAGTPAYMAPEQFAARGVDPRSDQFSFCIALWEALYGWRPFKGDDPISLAASVLDGRVVDPKQPGRVPAAIEAVLRRGLSTDPDARYPSMTELIEALERVGSRRSPWLRLGAIAAAATAVGATAIVLAASRDDPCPDSTDRLDGVWDDATRASVETAVQQHREILGTETWASLEPMLDAYASAWVEERRDACEATHVRNEQSEQVWALRVACLDGRLQSLRAVVELFAEGDLAVVATAVDAAEHLPALEQCADVEGLQHQTPPPAPELAARVDAAEAALSRATALRFAAEFDEATAVATTAIEEAVELGYEPTIAAARIELGRTLVDVGRPHDAREQFIDAFFVARHGHDEAGAAEAAVEAFSCASSRLYRLDEAVQWARHADLALEAAGDPEALRIMYLQELAELRRNQGHPRESTRISREAVDRLQTTQYRDSIKLAMALASHGRGLGTLGRTEEALAAFDAALVIVRRRLGDSHPHVADILSARAIVRHERGEVELARSELAEALRLYRRVFGEQHPFAAVTEVSLAGTYPQNDETAVALLDAVLARQKRNLPAGHPDIAITQANLGGRLCKVGRTDDGLALLQAGLEGLEAVYDPRHPLVGATHHTFAVALFAAGRREEALAHMTTALAIDRDRLSRSHPVLVGAVSNVAVLNMALERYEDAIPLLEEALELQAGRRERQINAEVGLASALVRACVHTGRLDEADAAVLEALRLAQESGEQHAMDSVEAEQAALLWARGEHRRGLDLAIEVRGRLNPATAVEGDDTIAVLDERIARWRGELGER